MEIPNGWNIELNPKPIPDRRHDWDFWHEDNDVEGLLCGTAASQEEALELAWAKAEIRNKVNTLLITG